MCSDVRAAAEQRVKGKHLWVFLVDARAGDVRPGGDPAVSASAEGEGHPKPDCFPGDGARAEPTSVHVDSETRQAENHETSGDRSATHRRKKSEKGAKRECVDREGRVTWLERRERIGLCRGIECHLLREPTRRPLHSIEQALVRGRTRTVDGEWSLSLDHVEMGRARRW